MDSAEVRGGVCGWLGDEIGVDGDLGDDGELNVCVSTSCVFTKFFTSPLLASFSSSTCSSVPANFTNFTKVVTRLEVGGLVCTAIDCVDSPD